jgi:hypothetical protein
MAHEATFTFVPRDPAGRAIGARRAGAVARG